MFVFFFFFFKRKTADDLRISDWSADVCASDRDARPRGLFHPSLDAQSLGQTPQHRIEVMARALAATAAVGRDRLLPVEAGPGDRISRHVGYFGAARNFRRGASGGPE